MPKQIINYDLNIKLPKAKMNFLIKTYIACNQSQTFLGETPISFKKTLSKNVNDPDSLSDAIIDDLTNLLREYFDYVDINIDIVEKGSYLIVTMGLVCDGASYKNDVTVKGLEVISDNQFLDIYYKEN